VRSAGRVLLAAALGALVPAAARGQQGGDAAWPAYGGGPANLRYSSLDQIDRESVSELEVAWIHHTGDPGETQCQPIVVDRVLYCTSAALKVFALRADTGEELWRFDPFAGEANPRRHVNRGVVYWADGADRRILFTAGPRLYALDARTGRPVPGFGRDGSVDLKEGLEGVDGGDYVVATSPGVVYRDLLIQGTRVSEGEGAAPGHVRAYDVRTGAVRWIFRTVPRPRELGSETWPEGAWRRVGGANSWAGMSVDSVRGIVYVPTGSATPDFYGGARAGENLFANSVLALDAATGGRIWHFQTVHHDIWDRDLPAPPNLVTVTHEGRRIDALAQITKAGFVFLLDRETGVPLFPVEERPVPASDLKGEVAWPTQPVPVRPAPFARQRLGEEDVTNISPEARSAVLARLRTLRSDGQFVPPSVEGTVIFPGFDGGGEWGGAAVDPETGVLYVNASEMPWIAAMVEQPDSSASAAPRAGDEVYAAVCAGCHGSDRSGSGDRGPSLLEVGTRRTPAEIRRIIDEGAGFMPSFANLPAAEREAVAAYLLGHATQRVAVAGQVAAPRPGSGASYGFAGYERFLDPDGYPAVKPPWGTLNASDLNRGEILWTVPLGEFPELTARGVPITGTENYGGPLVTAGGLVFIAAARDAKLRAFDKATGALLWEGALPAGGYATPSTYAVDGRQYVVIAAGGGKMGTPASDSYVAFALPRGATDR
jgi:quinoprotein glucose dehydrogenase